MARLYVSQEQMDQWTTGGKVALEDDLMTVAALGRTFRIETAVRVLSLVGGDDTISLVGKVKTQDELAKSGFERFGSSLVAGDAAYECEEGFLGTPTDSADTDNLSDLGKQ